MVSYKSYKTMGVLAILVCFIGFLVLRGAKQGRDERPQNNLAKEQLAIVERLLAGGSKEIGAARAQLIAARKRLIKQLIEIITEEQNRRGKRAVVNSAMLVLGEMRAVEAVDVLVEYIGFPELIAPGWATPHQIGGMGRGTHRLPAVDALIKIGEPCLDAVMGKLAGTESGLAQKACLRVLRGLRDREYVIYMLEKAVEKEKDPKRIENLQRAIERLTPKKKEAKEESAETKP
jgi:hypothetical protein